MFDYSPTNDSNFTSKICHVLDDENFQLLRDITPQKLAKTFGERKVEYYEYERGYTDPEWYFKSPDGQVAGIGFRWGVPRLRGKHLTEERANSFIKVVCAMINIANTRG